MNQKTLLYFALGLIAMRWLVRESRTTLETDLVDRLRLAGAL
jgi:hypothetical protein